MAWISVNEHTSGREAHWSFSDGPKSEYTRSFICVSDDTIIELAEVLQLSGKDIPGPVLVPQMGDEYPGDKGASVNDLRVQQIGDERLVFMLIIGYGNPPPSGHGHEPPDLDWEFTTDSSPREVVAEYDYGITDLDSSITDNMNVSATSREATNSAIEAFDPPLMRTEYDLVINLSKFFSKWKLETQNLRQGYINSKSVKVLDKTFEAYCLKCTKWTTGGKKFVDGGEYFRLQAQFIYRRPYLVRSNGEDVLVPGWLDPIIDAGFNHRPAGAGTPLLPILDGAGKGPTDVPQKLDGNGVQVVASQPEAVYMLFRTKLEANMKTWSLPKDIP